MKCNKVHTCPVCSAHIRAERGELIRRALLEGLREYADQGVAAQMVTLTTGHDWHSRTDDQRYGVMKAWDRTRSSGSVARIFKRRVRGSVRGAEVKFGGFGPHFHLHGVMLTEEWTSDERAVLLREWRRNVVRELGIAALPSEEHGVVWSQRRTDSGAAAYYVTKLGLEVTHVAAKAGAKGSRAGRTQWEVAQAAADGCETSKRLWFHYEKAMRGLRVINMDRRMAALAKRGAVADLPAPNEEPIKPKARVFIPIADTRLTFIRWLERWHPRALKLVLEAAAAPGEMTEEAVGARVDACIAWMVAVNHGSNGSRAGPYGVIVGQALSTHHDLRRAA